MFEKEKHLPPFLDFPIFRTFCNRKHKKKRMRQAAIAKVWTHAVVIRSTT
jgi:hypothetical protein